MHWRFAPWAATAAQLTVQLPSTLRRYHALLYSEFMSLIAVLLLADIQSNPRVAPGVPTSVLTLENASVPDAGNVMLRSLSMLPTRYAIP